MFVSIRQKVVSEKKAFTAAFTTVCDYVFIACFNPSIYFVEKGVRN